MPAPPRDMLKMVKSKQIASASVETIEKKSKNGALFKIYSRKFGKIYVREKIYSGKFEKKYVRVNSENWKM